MSRRETRGTEAEVLQMLGVEASTPIGAVGDIAFNTNSVETITNIDPFLEKAQASDNLHDLLLPSGNGKLSAMHNKVRYWSVGDTNEAAFSVLTLLSNEVVVPNLRRRALTKQAYSWVSLLTIIVAILAYALAATLNVGGEPPVDFVRFLLVLVVLFWVGSRVFTHRYWKLDR